MPIFADYSKYVCAGCGKAVYLGKDDKTQKERWKERRRVNADTVEETNTLCEGCLPRYDALVKDQDKAVAALFAALAKGE